ncbi:MAG: helix-turn-helix domain-containing protein [Firmicutes bacterium]|nr:helix-turn-helix domain-containing protein [Bacillota bacterium]
MDKITREEYTKIYDLLTEVAKDRNSRAAEELYKMFQPLILSLSKDPLTNKFDSELNSELNCAAYAAIMKFDIILESSTYT